MGEDSFFGSLNSQLHDLEASIGRVNESFKGMLDNLGQLSETGGQTFNKLDEAFYKLNETAMNLISGTTTLKGILGGMIGTIMGIGKAIIAISLNPFIMGLMAAAGAIALITKGTMESQRRFVELDQAAQDFRENTGFTKNMISKELNSAIVGSSVFAQKSASAAAALANEYGNINLLTKEAVKTTVQLSERLGIAEQNAAGFLDKMQNIYGMSEDTSRSIAQSVAHLAEVSGVAPDKVFGDIQNLSEEVLGIIGNYPGKLASAAVKARQLGLDINNVAKIAKQLLDIESAIQAEMEASVLLGKQINMDKARELTLSGDLEGAMNEILAQTGGITEFNRLNMIQKEALAKAAGMDLNTLQKTLTIQDKLNKAGKLNAQTQAEISQALKSGNVELAEQLLKENHIDGAVKSREKAMKSAMDKIAAVFMDIYEAFRPIIDELIKIIPPIAKIIRTILDASGITDMVKEWAVQIREFVKSIDTSSETFQNIKTALTEIFKFTMKLFGGVFTLLKGIFTNDEAEIQKGIDSIIESFKTFYSKVSEIIMKYGPTILKNVVTALGQIFKSIIVMLVEIIKSPEFKEMLKTILTALVDGLKMIGKVLTETNIIGDLLKVLGDALIELLNYLGPLLGEILKGIGKFLATDGAKILQTAIKGLLDFLINILLSPGLMDLLEGLFAALMGTLAAIFNYETLKSVFDGLLDFISVTMLKIPEILERTFAQFSLGKMFEDTIRAILDAFKKLPEVLGNIARGILGALWALIGELFKIDWIGLIVDLFETLTDVVLGLLGQAVLLILENLPMLFTGLIGWFLKLPLTIGGAIVAGAAALWGIIKGLGKKFIELFTNIDFGAIWKRIKQEVRVGWLQIKRILPRFLGGGLSEEEQREVADYWAERARDKMKKTEEELRKKAEEEEKKKMDEALKNAKETGEKAAETAVSTAEKAAEELAKKVDLSKVTQEQLKKLASFKLSDEQLLNLEKIRNFLQQNEEPVKKMVGYLSAIGEGAKKFGEGLYLMTQADPEKIQKTMTAISNADLSGLFSKFTDNREKIATAMGVVETIRAAFENLMKSVENLPKIGDSMKTLIENVQKLINMKFTGEKTLVGMYLGVLDAELKLVDKSASDVQNAIGKLTTIEFGEKEKKIFDDIKAYADANNRSLLLMSNMAERFGTGIKNLSDGLQNIVGIDTAKINEFFKILNSEDLKNAINYFTINQANVAKAKDFFVEMKEMANAVHSNLKDLPEIFNSLKKIEEEIKKPSDGGEQTAKTNGLANYFKEAKASLEELKKTIDAVLFTSINYFNEKIQNTLDIAEKLQQIDLKKAFMLDHVDKLERVARAIELIANSLSKINVGNYLAVVNGRRQEQIVATVTPQGTGPKFDMAKLSTYDKEKMLKETKKELEIDEKTDIQKIIQSKKNDPQVILLYQILMALRDGLQIDGYKISKALG